MANIELLAAETMLEEGVALPIKAPLFLRIFGYKKLKIHRPTAGNLLRIDRLYLGTGISDAELENIDLTAAKQLEIKHTYTHARILVFGMFKGYLLPLLLNRLLAKWLLWHLTQKQISGLAEILLSLGGTASFMNTTRYIRAMSLTTPKNLGQKPQKN